MKSTNSQISKGDYSNYIPNGIKWITINVYVDIETGEVLQYWKQDNLQEEYNIIRKHKKTQRHGNNTKNALRGSITITNECRRKTARQGTLFGGRSYKRTNR